MFDALNHQLGDAITSRQRERLGRVKVYQQNPKLVSVPTINQAGAVKAGHPVAQGQPAAGLNETGGTER